MKRDLIRLGFDPANITMKGLSGADFYDALGKRGSDFDMGVSVGSCSDLGYGDRRHVSVPLVFGDDFLTPEVRAKMPPRSGSQGRHGRGRSGSSTSRS